MKKNISINISGIIFHIEEDGYESLKKYLDSINKYFSTFEDSSEILADIESRIAEIFLSRLNEEKQVITAEDVNTLKATMGSVSDFKAAEEDREEKQTTGAEEQPADAEPASTSGGYTYTPPKQLRRDQKRKILGGVCAGLGNYFDIDPLWIRLLFAVLFFAYGITLFIYAVMWIVVPGSYDLEEPAVSKKMFRDPERKVIGGVSGGVAAYLGIDIIAVRVLFILFTLAGGLGLFIYIVLWIILPEARTITDKMQMQGEPLTLSNIESTIKKNLNVNDGEESTATRIILFPFRLIGMILTGLGKMIGPLVDIVRVFIGILVILTGMSLLFALVVTAGVLAGLFTATVFTTPWSAEFQEMNLPIEIFTRAFPGWIVLAAFTALLVPILFIILLGASAIAKRIVFHGTAGWTLFVIFFISIAMLGVGIPKIIYAFHEEGDYEVESHYTPTGKTAVLKAIDREGYQNVRLSLRGYEGKDFKLLQSFEAQGSSRSKAAENAQMVTYQVSVEDSVFAFPRHLDFKEDAVFRAQRLDMTLYIPYNFPFIMDEEMSRFITQYVDYEYRDGYTWEMTPDGLRCLTCGNNREEEEDDRFSDLSDFNGIEINGRFNLRIIRGENYAVEMSGSERDKERYSIFRSGETLVIDFEGRSRNNDWDVNDFSLKEMQIEITMPTLEKIEAAGMGTIRMDDFTSTDLEIETRGPVKTRGTLNAHKVTINLSGKSEADLAGNANIMNARVEFASKLRAYNLEVTDAFVEVNGASSAKVHVTGTLETDEGVASDIDYRGNPQVIKRD